MRKLKTAFFLLAFCAVFAAGCGGGGQEQPPEDAEASGGTPEEAAPGDRTNAGGMPENEASENETSENEASGNEATGSKTPEQAPPGDGSAEEPSAQAFIHPEGMTLAERIAVPEGFSRVQAEDGSLATFLREYPMKEDGSPVLLYDGREKGNQSAHAAVFALPIENEDLQQCADSVMRMYAEYFWESGQKERIAFHFVNGFYAEYTRWRDGGRIQVSGNEVSWVRTADYDDSYENLKKYLRYVFSYASTLSMEGESEPVSADEVDVGDVFLKGGSPGHVVMVVDLCEDMQGEKAFLLAQGYMPAQEFHVLNNPLHPDDPWYYERELAFPLATPEYTFGEGSLRRLGY